MHIRASVQICAQHSTASDEFKVLVNDNYLQKSHIVESNKIMYIIRIHSLQICLGKETIRLWGDRDLNLIEISK